MAFTITVSFAQLGIESFQKLLKAMIIDVIECPVRELI